ncbi:MAG: hypothetical protein JO041_03560 [Acidobacteria bacterium]|nr:hypothetical protein [Acidobacteriota bacterium]
MPLRWGYFSLLILLALSSLAYAQTPIPTGKVTAAAVQLALTGGAIVSDITLSATATWIAGSTNQTGSAQLISKGTGEALFQLANSSFSVSELRNDSDGPGGQSSDSTGAMHILPPHNCWMPAAWFSPAAVIQVISGSAFTLTDVGQELHEGAVVDHVQAQITSSGQRPRVAAVIQKLSTTDVFFDPESHLPVAIAFNTHPADDLTRDIPVEVRFSDYRTVNGIKVPFHIQRFLSGTLQLDVTVSSAAINSGVADSAFALQ